MFKQYFKYKITGKSYNKVQLSNMDRAQMFVK